MSIYLFRKAILDGHHHGSLPWDCTQRPGCRINLLLGSILKADQVLIAITVLWCIIHQGIVRISRRPDPLTPNWQHRGALQGQAKPNVQMMISWNVTSLLLFLLSIFGRYFLLREIRVYTLSLLLEGTLQDWLAVNTTFFPFMGD